MVERVGLLLDNHLVGLEVVLMVSLCLIGFQILTVQYRKFFSSHCGTYEKSLEIVSYLFSSQPEVGGRGNSFPSLVRRTRRLCEVIKKS